MRATRTSSRAAGTLAAALAGVACVWLIGWGGAVPLFDGVGFPDEPYRYVSPPAGARHTAPPTEATATSDVGNGGNAHPFYVNSAEIGPQIAVFIDAKGLTVSGTASSVTIAATPLAPDVEPSVGPIDGNVYRISATADAATVSVAANGSATVTMRATSARQPPPVFVYRESPTTTWRQLSTARVGNDIYRTTLSGFGDYALAFTSASGHSGRGFPVWAAVLGAVVVLLAGLLLVIRRTHGRRGSDPA
jgi:hypothetical protein